MTAKTNDVDGIATAQGNSSSLGKKDTLTPLLCGRYAPLSNVGPFLSWNELIRLFYVSKSFYETAHRHLSRIDITSNTTVLHRTESTSPPSPTKSGGAFYACTETLHDLQKYLSGQSTAITLGCNYPLMQPATSIRKAPVLRKMPDTTTLIFSRRDDIKEVLQAISMCSRLIAVDLDIMSWNKVAKMSQDDVRVFSSNSSSFSSLQNLSLQASLVEDISFVSILPALKSLELRDCHKIRDISALPSCRNLEKFTIGSTVLEDISGLSRCQNLQEFWLCAFSKVSDISPLATCPSLQTVYLSQNHNIKDISALVSCSFVQDLHINQTGVVDISPLSALPMLRSLSLSETKVCDLSPLASCKETLNNMWLDKNPLLNNENFKDLSKCTSLRQLSFSNTKVSDISCLSSCKRLNYLTARNTKVSKEQAIALKNDVEQHRPSYHGGQALKVTIDEGVF